MAESSCLLQLGDLDLHEELLVERQVKRRRRMIESSSSSSSSSSSLLQLEDLQDELLIEIFCRVSNYRDLMRCECVCKRWFFLISNPDPYLVACHRFCSMKKLRPWSFIYGPDPFIYCSKSSTSGRKIKITSKDSMFQSPGFTFSFLPRQPEPEPEPVPIGILHTSNDLVLCSPRRRGYYHRVYYLCNPLTKQWVALPRPPPSARGCVVMQSRYMFDPYDILVNLICESDQKQPKHGSMALCRFKVVRFHKYENFGTTLELDIFSSETRQWIKHQVEMLPNKPFPDSSIVETVTGSGTLFAKALNAQILVLDLNSIINNNANGSTNSNDHHHYHVLQLPTRNYISTLMVYQGHLRVVHINKNTKRGVVPDMYIWELKKDYYKVKVDCEYWSLVHRASLKEMVVSNHSHEWFSENILKTRLMRSQGGFHIIALDFQPDDGNILCLSFNDRIASYDMWNKTLTFHPKTRSRSIRQGRSPFLQLLLPLCPTTIPKI